MISIIIPTLNEKKYLPKLLKSIKKQTFSDYEIIVSDANSKDKTKEIALEYGCKLVKGGRPAVGRNAGAKVANGEYLLFLDADVILPEDFLKKAIKQFDREYLEMATVLQKPISEVEIDKLIYKIHNILLKYTSEIYPLTVGVCILTTRRLHRRLNGFNEKMDISEDNDYGKRAKKIASYGTITDTCIKISVRRFNKEGRIKLAQKYIRHGVFEQLAKFGINKQIKYEFGDFQDVKSFSKLESQLEKILRFLNKIFKSKKDKNVDYKS